MRCVDPGIVSRPESVAVVSGAARERGTVEMCKYRVTGNYGTFQVSRVVEADSCDGAFAQTGIATTLEAAGWTVDGPEGESWVIERFVDGAWVEVDEDDCVVQS